MTTPRPSTGSERLVVFLCCAVAIGAVLFIAFPESAVDPHAPHVAETPRVAETPLHPDVKYSQPSGDEKLKARRRANPLRYAPENTRSTAWWDGVPDQVRAVSTQTGPESNIHPADYAGAESCQKCHKKNYDSWSKHPHRWMNALATEENVRGDFSGDAGISHLGGRAEFFRRGESLRMTTERSGQRREYVIHQTIGSRFFQYYIGKQVQGPTPPGMPTYERDHVLPFGYWLDAGEWVPVVHVYPEDDLPDGERTDAFAENFPLLFYDYAAACNHCHTTFPAADQLVRIPHAVSRHAPHPLHFWVSEYLAEAHPELWDASEHTSTIDASEFLGLINTLESYEAPQHAVTLGIGCEACHLGCKDHSAGLVKKPSFFPKSPHLLVENGGAPIQTDRNHDNVNWACSRCHAGTRPQYAATMSTWNSTESTDAARGACYSQLQCIDCHDPHEAIGPKWKNTPIQDDALCLRCHDNLKTPQARVDHTHHPLGSAGSRCMDCHMPRLNEGLQDVVRTHTITSPTERRMIESNEPNACNMCHTDKPVDWTLTHLQEWFGVEYNERKLKENYPHRDGPVATGWLKSEKSHVRLIGADSLFRMQSTWALSNLVTALDDPYLINRQFARIGIEELFGVTLKDFGYQFYMTPDERSLPIKRIHDHLETTAATTPEPIIHSVPAGENKLDILSPKASPADE